MLPFVAASGAPPMLFDDVYLRAGGYPVLTQLSDWRAEEP